MQSKAMVQSNGNVFWPPPAKLRSTCKIDITYFPFDDQSCTMKFGSWTYDGWQVNVIKRHDEVDTSNYIENGEWDLLKVVVERHETFYPCCAEPYPDLRFTIYMRRRTLYYLFNIIFPCLWLTVLSLISFWLPPDSGEKITLGITVLLAFSVFMLLIAENMPATSEFVPLIGVYLTVTMTMTSLSIILTVLVLHLHHTGSNRHALPKYIRVLFFDHIARIFCLDVVQRYQMNRRNTSKRANQSRYISLQTINKNTTDNDENRKGVVEMNLKNSNEQLLSINPASQHSSYLNKKLHYNYLSSEVITSVVLSDEKTSTSKCAETFSNTTAEQHSSLVNEQYERFESSNRLSFPKLNTMNPSTEETFKRHKQDRTVRIDDNLNKGKTSTIMTYNYSNNEYDKKQGHEVVTTLEQSEIASDHRVDYARLSDDLINDLTPSKLLNVCPPHHRHRHDHQAVYNTQQIEVLGKLVEILERAEKQQEIIQIYLHNLHEKQFEEYYISDIINEWRILALIVDRMLFWLFLVVAVIATTVILLIMPLFKPNFA
ncbi:unnamed protein product [Heterobilharzia americana]|nr:unnamed protein product [Heterobilharzia americana]